VKFDFIAAKEVALAVATMCRVFGVSSSGFYAFKARPAPKRAADARLATAPLHTRRAEASTAVRACTARCTRKGNLGKKRIERLMHEKGLRGRCKTALRPHDRFEARPTERSQHPGAKVRSRDAESSVGR
jgi:putative transposase